jgi:dihydropyrimidine dehydrogenase (NAD+) subunit PreT
VTVADVYAELVPPLGEAEALLEADACLECGGPYAPAPCAEACPANIDVPGFVGAIANGDPEGAAELIFAENLLGGSCARVCPVETLCEGACVLAHDGRAPIAIGALQRYATDVAFGRGVRPRTRRAPSGKRVAVLGAGPAGLACAGELALLGHDVTIYDARDEIGGLVRFAIAPYRQLREPLPAEAEAIARLGVEFRLGTPIESAEALDRLEDEHDACVLAVGLGDDVDIGYPGDELDGV